MVPSRAAKLHVAQLFQALDIAIVHLVGLGTEESDEKTLAAPPNSAAIFTSRALNETRQGDRLQKEEGLQRNTCTDSIG